MIYKNPGEGTRHLQRLWEVIVFEDNQKDKKKPKTRKETIIAWNAVDAIRRAPGEVAERPVPVGFVTWPPENGETEDRFIIEDQHAGPTNKKVKPTISPIQAEEEDW